MGEIRTRLKKFRKSFSILFAKFLKHYHRPAKFSYSFFLKVAQKFGRIENFAPPEAQGSLMSLVRAVYHDLLRRVPARSNQGRNDGCQGAQFPGRRITMKPPNDCGAPKSPNNVTSGGVAEGGWSAPGGTFMGAALWAMGPSINDVTLFWEKIYPLPPCHISSQVFKPLQI